MNCVLPPCARPIEGSRPPARVNRMIVRWSWRRGGRTWLGEVGDDADGVGNGLQARVRGAEALPLVRGRARARFVHRHGVVVAAAADLVVLLLPHIARALKPTLRPRLRRNARRSLPPAPHDLALAACLFPSLDPQLSSSSSLRSPPVALSGSWGVPIYIKINTASQDQVQRAGWP